MNPITAPFFQFKQRIGLHFFPDTLHYREHDYNTWLPILKSLHLSWIILMAPKDRAIPEAFIKGIQENKIEPLLHIADMPQNKQEVENLEPMIEAYAHWGVKHIIFYKQPNMRSAWSVKDWTQKNLVDQFLDKFTTAANLAVRNGIRPVFPPLHPGGDYWDTIFLKSALSKIKENNDHLIDHLQLASYAWTWGHSLNWGFGGPSNYTAVRPYASREEPDQRGFRNYEWYSQIAHEILGKDLPIHLLGAGSRFSPDHESKQQEMIQNPKEVISIARLVARENVYEHGDDHTQIKPLSENVKSVNFWLLSTEPDHVSKNFAWYPEPDYPSAVAKEFQKWALDTYKKDEKHWREKKKIMNLQDTRTSTENVSRKKIAETAFYPRPDSIQSPGIPAVEIKKTVIPAGNLQVDLEQSSSPPPVSTPTTTLKTMPTAKSSARPTTKGYKKPINHYLLLPTYEWGVSDWHLDVIRPFVKKHKVTIGFSIKEAVLAKKVTVVGNKQSFSDELLEKMRSVGCEVERIQGDGTSIASQLAMR